MKVLLYESNAGHLFLVHAGKVWMGLEQTGSTFREDAEAILRNDTSDWTIPVFKSTHTNVVETCQLVATFSSAERPNVDDELDELARQNCRCGGKHER